jgi:hypothetical protein
MSHRIPAGQEPPWLTAMIDQRLKAAEQAFEYARIAGNTVLMMTLTDPEEDTDIARQYWNESCDNCGRWSPTSLWPGHKTLEHDGIQVVITFGVCPDCKEGFL